MSKEERKPEPGDIWKNPYTGSMLHIIDVGGNYIEFIGVEADTVNDSKRYFVNSFSNLGKGDPRYTEFTKYMQYIGKAKAEPNDLFKF